MNKHAQFNEQNCEILYLGGNTVIEVVNILPDPGEIVKLPNRPDINAAFLSAGQMDKEDDRGNGVKVLNPSIVPSSSSSPSLPSNPTTRYELRKRRTPREHAEIRKLPLKKLKTAEVPQGHNFPLGGTGVSSETSLNAIREGSRSTNPNQIPTVVGNRFSVCSPPPSLAGGNGVRAPQTGVFTEAPIPSSLSSTPQPLKVVGRKTLPHLQTVSLPWSSFHSFQ